MAPRFRAGQRFVRTPKGIDSPPATGVTTKATHRGKRSLESAFQVILFTVRLRVQSPDCIL